MDKLMFDGRKVTISNDGATIMRLLDIVHPAAKTLVDISLSQVQTTTNVYYHHAHHHHHFYHDDSSVAASSYHLDDRCDDSPPIKSI